MTNLALLLLLHVGSPDVFYEGHAGPYRLLVTVRMPDVVPGVASVDIRVADADVERVRIVPLPLRGRAAQLPPVPDEARRAAADPRFFSGSLWIMTAGAWQVRVTALGARGAGELSVAVPALPARTRPMSRTLGLGLAALLALLAFGLVSIVGAAAREAASAPGAAVSANGRRRGRIGMGVAAVVLALGLGAGRGWWQSEAQAYARYVYKPLALETELLRGSPPRLALALEDPGWLRWRRTDDLVADHDHLMHLFVLRLPALDRVWHLHPEPTGAGRFSQVLPSMPAGRYQLFADVVHASGLYETAASEIELPDITGAELSGDDAAGPTASAQLSWLRDGAGMSARATSWLRFRSEGGGALEPYLGMAGHAAVVARDRSVFAHLHPTGSVPMALVMGQNPHAMHASGALPAEIGFPYAFPKPGAYRIFVQFKRAGRIETAAFDADVRE